MRFRPSLELGVLRRRYKRFFADVELQDGSTITVHCANTGTMRGCSEPGSQVAFSRHGRSDRKLAGRLELVRADGVWIGVYPALANALVAEACEAGRFAEWLSSRGLNAESRTADTADAGSDKTETAEARGAPAQVVRREVSVPGFDSRFDLELRSDGVRWLVEVKSVSWVEAGVGRFPDAKSTRARRHADELAQLAARGHRVALVFCVQRADVDRLLPAWEVDAEYGQALQRAARAGVVLAAHRCAVALDGIVLTDRVPVDLVV